MRHKAMTLSPKSSCAASCCMCCPAASTASGTGLLANGRRKQSLAVVRHLLMASDQGQPPVEANDTAADLCASPTAPAFVCHHCRQPLTILLTLARGPSSLAPPPCAGGP